VNEALLKATGYNREELIGKNARESGIFNDDEDLTRIIRLLVVNRSVYGMPFSFRTKNREFRHCLISSSVITIKERKYILSSVIDVTDQKKSEETLARSEQQFRELSNFMVGQGKNFFAKKFQI